MEEQPKSWLILRCRVGSERTECERLNGEGIPAMHPRVVRRFRRKHRTGSQRKTQTVKQGWALISGFIFLPVEASAGDDIGLIRRCAEGPKAKIHGYVANSTSGNPEAPYHMSAFDMDWMMAHAENEGRNRSSGAIDEGDWAVVALGSLAGVPFRVVRFLEDEVTAAVEVNLFGRIGEMKILRSELLPADE